MAASLFAAEGTEALSPRPPPKRRAEGTPSPATWWSARAGLFPGPLPGPPPGPGVSHPVIGPCGKQMVRWLVLDPRVVVCTVAVSLCRPPCYPVQDRSLDGAGPLPAWHQPSANEFIPPAGAVLCHLLPLCVISRASLRKLSSLVSHTAGGEEAAARVRLFPRPANFTKHVFQHFAYNRIAARDSLGRGSTAAGPCVIPGKRSHAECEP